jgi:hypothetical protein
MKKVIDSILLKLFGSKCPNCGKRELERGHYIRGWNDWCEQACGDRGQYCNSCGKVHFDRSDDEYLQILPYWCIFNGQSGKALTTKL